MPDFYRDVDGPASGATAVTPSDATDVLFRGLYIGVMGDLKVTALNGTAVTFKNATGVLPVSVTRVWSTGTTATSIVGLI